MCWTRGKKKLFSIQEELRFCKIIFVLAGNSFGDKPKSKLDLDNALGNVAPLALQLLLENAIKTHIVSQENPLFC